MRGDQRHLAVLILFFLSEVQSQEKQNMHSRIKRKSGGELEKLIKIPSAHQAKTNCNLISCIQQWSLGSS